MRRLSVVMVVGVVVAIQAPSAGAVGLTENFDGVTPPALPSGWTATHTTAEPADWTTSAASPDAGGLNNAFAPDVSGVGDKFLISPALTLDAAPTLAFRNSFNTETSSGSFFDGGVLEVSRNGGAFQDILAAGGTFAQGGYNHTISSSFGSPIAGRQAWAGNSGGYIDTRVNMPFVNDGDTIQLRWRMSSDSSVAVPTGGWRIDRVLLGNPPFGATTDPATALSTTGATLNGTFTSDLPATYQFQYGTSVAYGSQTAPIAVPASNSPQSGSDTISGLEPNTTYHFRLIVTNAFSSVSGPDGTFLTSSTPPPETPPPDNNPPVNPPDSTPPDTTITGLTQNKKKTRATFTFSANEAGSTFECAVDAGPFGACTSPTTLKGLKKGSHTFAVRARDTAGNADVTPAQQGFKIKKKRKRHHH